MPEDTIIKYAWRHGGLDATEHDTLDDAVSSAIYAADYGEESLQCIEVIGADGTTVVHDAQKVWEMGQPIRDQEDAMYAAAPPTVAVLEILSPVKGKAVFDSYSDPVAAEAGLAEWQGRVGERASLRWYKAR